MGCCGDGGYVYIVKNMAREERLQKDRLCMRRMRIGSAVSFVGGSVAAVFFDVPPIDPDKSISIASLLRNPAVWLFGLSIVGIITAEAKRFFAYRQYEQTSKYKTIYTDPAPD